MTLGSWRVYTFYSQSHKSEYIMVHNSSTDFYKTEFLSPNFMKECLDDIRIFIKYVHVLSNRKHVFYLDWKEERRVPKIFPTHSQIILFSDQMKQFWQLPGQRVFPSLCKGREDGKKKNKYNFETI